MILVAEQPQLRGVADHDLLRALRDFKCEWLLTLDQHRQPEVWRTVLAELADGSGRMIRIKPRQTEGMGIPVLTRHWANAYEGILAALTDPSKVLVQVGAPPWSNRRLKGGFGAYDRRAVAAMVQQYFSPAPDGSFRTQSRPRLREPKG